MPTASVRARSPRIVQSRQNARVKELRAGFPQRFQNGTRPYRHRRRTPLLEAIAAGVTTSPPSSSALETSISSSVSASRQTPKSRPAARRLLERRQHRIPAGHRRPRRPAGLLPRPYPRRARRPAHPHPRRPAGPRQPRHSHPLRRSLRRHRPHHPARHRQPLEPESPARLRRISLPPARPCVPTKTKSSPRSNPAASHSRRRRYRRQPPHPSTTSPAQRPDHRQRRRRHPAEILRRATAPRHHPHCPAPSNPSTPPSPAASSSTKRPARGPGKPPASGRQAPDESDSLRRLCFLRIFRGDFFFRSRCSESHGARCRKN